MIHTTIVNEKLLTDQWVASWITYPNQEPKSYNIYHFRKSFDLKSLPASFIIHLSADNKYRLFVNGKFVLAGPASGSIEQWFYETIDIAPFLIKGKNVIAAVVWNMGEHAARSQFSLQTALIIQGNTVPENLVNTNSTWKVLKNRGYTPCSLNTSARLNAYMAIGPGDQVNGESYPWDWEQTDHDDRNWIYAEEIIKGSPIANHPDGNIYWILTPRNIPNFKEDLLRFNLIRQTTGIKIFQDILSGNHTLIIPRNQIVSILLDMGENTVAYPEMIVSGGKHANIRLIYAEALLDDHGVKGNRNDIQDKRIYGNYDIFNPDGNNDRKFRPLWFRAYRYLQIDIVTKDEPLIIQDIYSMTTGYPLELNASFESNDPSLREIWEVGWRTAKLCAGDVYYDTPYYEQLQYVGDSRIQALISLYMSGDDRLMKKSILDFYHSRLPEGLTQSRYPSIKLQVIPAFSLFWVSMVHDYWMHKTDNEFIKSLLPTIKNILNWFETKIDDTSMLGPLPWWNFVDWDNFDGMGTAPGSKDGNSSIVTLHFSYTLRIAAELFTNFNEHAEAQEFIELSNRLNKGTLKACYHTEIGLLADTPQQTSFSQHAGIWAILSGTFPSQMIQPMIVRILTYQRIAQVTYFYRFYLTQALKKAGMADLYYNELNPWREMVRMGLTTFAEKPEPTRSDCHGWSASPNYDFLATICGIMPNAPGFQQILIKPALGELTEVSGKMPHPNGEITVHLRRNGYGGIYAEIYIPLNTEGIFIWNNQQTKLNGGKQIITIRSNH